MRIGEIKHSYYLEGILSGGKSWIIPIEKFPFTIGRNPDCSLFLSSDNISRQHAVITYRDGNLYIMDKNSTNGSLLNNKKISRETEIKDRNTLTFAEFEFIIHISNPEKSGIYHKTLVLNQDEKNGFSAEYNLTNKESEVLIFLIKGEPTEKIAKRLSISTGTAKNHILSIYKKTDTHSKFELFTLYNEFKK
ncbi:MAG: FHA domain-containing protein [Spirochaetes bacterium]|nr:FHA domain-containing protein [Spirochaetota bacterium]